MHELGFVSYLIICPLLFLAGFVDSIAGGGGLISLPAYLIAGLPAHQAVATNKLSSTMGTSIATWQYAKNGFIPWKTALLCAVFAIGGSSAGANLNLLISDRVLKILMLFLLPLSAVLVLKSKALVSEQEAPETRKTLLLSVLVALVIGLYDGFYGPGTGTFLLLFLTIFAHMKVTTANGTTKVINLSSNIAALTVYLVHNQVLIPLGLAAGLFNIAGNWLGARTFTKKGTKIVKPVMLTVLGLFFLRILLELFQVI